MKHLETPSGMSYSVFGLAESLGTSLHPLRPGVYDVHVRIAKLQSNMYKISPVMATTVPDPVVKEVRVPGPVGYSWIALAIIVGWGLGMWTHRKQNCQEV